MQEGRPISLSTARPVCSGVQTTTGMVFSYSGALRKRPSSRHTSKGVVWLNLTKGSVSLTVRLSQCILNHAPIRDFWHQFIPDGNPACPWGAHLETRNHIFHWCPRTNQSGVPTMLGCLVSFLEENLRAFTFSSEEPMPPPEGIG